MNCVERNSGAAGRNRAVAGTRRIWCAVVATFALLWLSPAAGAGDLGDGFLRGSFWSPPSSQAYSRWNGIYFGGQLGMSSATVDYSHSLNSLTGYIVRSLAIENQVLDLIIMGQETKTHANFGAFIGYNYQVESDLVVGAEFNYSYLNLDSNQNDTISRRIQNDTQAPTGHHFFYNTTVSGNAALHITDFATFRARAGWQTGQFLPYAFAGLAVGRANLSRASTVSFTTEDIPDTQIPPITPNPPAPMSPTSKGEALSNVIMYGFAAGLGVDVAITPNMFLRAEWEYVQFAPVHNIQASINTGRVGVGLKF